MDHYAYRPLTIPNPRMSANMSSISIPTASQRHLSLEILSGHESNEKPPSAPGSNKVLSLHEATDLPNSAAEGYKYSHHPSDVAHSYRNPPRLNPVFSGTAMVQPRIFPGDPEFDIPQRSQPRPASHSSTRPLQPYDTPNTQPHIRLSPRRFQQLLSSSLTTAPPSQGPSQNSINQLPDFNGGNSRQQLDQQFQWPVRGPVQGGKSYPGTIFREIPITMILYIFLL